MRKLYLLFFLPLFLLSCKNDPTDLLVSFNQTALLTIKVIDNSGNPVQGAEVVILNGLFEGVTNDKGLFEVGKVLEGEYSVDVYYKKGNVEYSDSKYFQVIALNNKEVILNPEANAGSAVITVYSYSGEPVSGVNVVLSTSSIPSYYFFDELPSLDLKDKTNQNGTIRFDNLPTGTDYRMYHIYVYSGNLLFSISPNYIHVEKGEDTFTTVRLYNY